MPHLTPQAIDITTPLISTVTDIFVFQRTGSKGNLKRDHSGEARAPEEGQGSCWQSDRGCQGGEYYWGHEVLFRCNLRRENSDML